MKHRNGSNLTNILIKNISLFSSYTNEKEKKSIDYVLIGIDTPVYVKLQNPL